MSLPILKRIQQDDLAMSVARALTIANETAVAQGTDLSQSLITITEEAPPPESFWQVHYGPRGYKNRRGGDLIIVVNDRTGTVSRVIRGQ